MEGMFEIDVLVINYINGTKGPERQDTIAISIGMGIRISQDAQGTCWISLTDNSVWKSAHDYRTTVDKISGILRHL